MPVAVHFMGLFKFPAIRSRVVPVVDQMIHSFLILYILWTVVNHVCTRVGYCIESLADRRGTWNEIGMIMEYVYIYVHTQPRKGIRNDLRRNTHPCKVYGSVFVVDVHKEENDTGLKVTLDGVDEDFLPNLIR